jgi:hypothetical protein
MKPGNELQLPGDDIYRPAAILRGMSRGQGQKKHIPATPPALTLRVG